MSDDYYANVALLLPMNGADGGTVFTDWSPSPIAVTAAGNAHTETDQSKFYGSSGYFDGTGDYLSMPPTGLSLGTGDFTLEARVWLTNASAYQFITGTSNSGGGYMMWGLNNSGNNVSVGKCGVAWPLVFPGFSVSNNTWVHIAVSRAGTSNRCFVNGTQIGSTITDATNWTVNSGLFYVGAQPGGNNISGYIQDLRITKGAARYTANFTPPGSLLKTIAGTVTDANGDPAERVVIAVPRTYPCSNVWRTLSAAADGAYSFTVPDTECAVIALADEADDYNDAVARVFPG